MTEQEQVNDGLLLAGLDGANPLAFLAALGTLRGLTIAWPGHRVHLSWKLRDTWRPYLYRDDGVLDEEKVLDGLESFMDMRPGHEALEIADNLPIPLGDFRRHACSAADIAFTCPNKRTEGDFIAAFGSDVFADRQGRVQDTALRAVGTGQTRFIKTMRDLAEKVGRDKLRQCLFSQWERQDPRLSLRWDPEDDRRYALRSKAPTSEVTQTEWGANRLAYESLPLFPGYAHGEVGSDHRIFRQQSSPYILDMAHLGRSCRSGYRAIPVGTEKIAGIQPGPPGTGRYGYQAGVQGAENNYRRSSQRVS